MLLPVKTRFVEVAIMHPFTCYSHPTDHILPIQSQDRVNINVHKMVVPGVKAGVR